MYPPPLGEGDPLISPDYAGWWRRALAIVKRAWPALATIQVIALGVNIILQAPIAVYAALVAADYEATLEQTPEGQFPDLSPVLGVVGFAVIALFIGIVVAATVTLASTHIGVAVAIGREPEVGTALRSSLPRVFPLIGWQLLAGLMILVGLCACILPGLYLIAVLTIVPVVVAFERVNAISRSFSLFHNDIGASLARVATVVGITFAGGILGSLFGNGAVAIIERSITETTGLVVGGVVSTGLTSLVSGAVAVLVAPLLLTAYADMRARKEPLSTAVLARELGMS